MKKTIAQPYDWNVLCQICREKIKASESVRRWDGLIVGARHAGCFEYRSPLDMPAPPLRDQRPLPFTSPRSVDTSTVQGSSSDISVTASPFTYTTGSSPERITFSGTITNMVMNGQTIPPPTSAGDNVSNILFAPRTTLIITYSGTLTMSTVIVTGFSDSISSIG